MAARQNNPRKFSDKIALMNQRQEAKTNEFQAIMKEVSMVKPTPRCKRGNTLTPRHPYPGHELSRSCPDNGGMFEANFNGGGASDNRLDPNYYNEQFGHVSVRDRGGGGGAMRRQRSREERSPSPYNRDISPHSYYRSHSPNSTSCSPHSRYSSSPHSPTLDNQTASSQVILQPRKSSPTSNYLCPPSTTSVNMKRSSSDSNINNIPWEPPSSTEHYSGLIQVAPPSHPIPTQNLLRVAPPGQPNLLQVASPGGQHNASSNPQFKCPVNLVPRDQASTLFPDHSADLAPNRDPNNTQQVSSVSGDSSPTIIITSCDNESRNFLHMNRSVITVNKNHKNFTAPQDPNNEYRAPFSPPSPGTPDSVNDYSSQNSPTESVNRLSPTSSSPVQNYQSSGSPVRMHPSGSPVHNHQSYSSSVHNQQLCGSSVRNHPSGSPVINHQSSGGSPILNHQSFCSPVHILQSSESPTHYTYQSPSGVSSSTSLSQAVNTIRLNCAEDNMRLNNEEENMRMTNLDGNLRLRNMRFGGVQGSVNGVEHIVENIGTNDSISLDDWMKINLPSINQVLVNGDKEGARRKDSDEVCEILHSTNKSDQMFEPISETIDEEFINKLLSG